MIGCAHMLCPKPAGAMLLFDPRQTAAWLLDLYGTNQHGLPLCSSHADRFRQPVHWSLSDLRSKPADPPADPGGGATPSLLDAEPVAEPAGSDTPAEPAPIPEPVATPLLSRAFRTTEQVSD